MLRVAAELQASLAERVEYDRVIRYLLSRAKRSEKLLREACTPVKVARAELRKELLKGRAEDRRRERALEQAYA